MRVCDILPSLCSGQIVRIEGTFEFPTRYTPRNPRLALLGFALVGILVGFRQVAFF